MTTKKILVLTLFIIACLFSCDAFETSADFRYTVTGTAKTASLTYENADGGTSQESDVVLPWEYSFSLDKSTYNFLYISAQNGTREGTVIVTIYKDGDVYKTSTSSGAFTIATASGSYN